MSMFAAFDSPTQPFMQTKQSPQKGMTREENISYTRRPTYNQSINIDHWKNPKENMNAH
jgi:hypothetical protein